MKIADGNAAATFAFPNDLSAGMGFRAGADFDAGAGLNLLLFVSIPQPNITKQTNVYHPNAGAGLRTGFVTIQFRDKKYFAKQKQISRHLQRQVEKTVYIFQALWTRSKDPLRQTVKATEVRVILNSFLNTYYISQKYYCNV